jgi:hypothetical protein
MHAYCYQYVTESHMTCPAAIIEPIPVKMRAVLVSLSARPQIGLRTVT